MKLRPHHLIDIITDYGHDVEFKPHPYGHAVHTVAAKVLANLDLEVEFVVAADAICLPCQHLQPDGQCDDVLHQLASPVLKQTYNDELDNGLFAHFGMKPGVRMTVGAFLKMLAEHTPGIEKLCTHPGEEQASRLEGLKRGLARLECGSST